MKIGGDSHKFSYLEKFKSNLVPALIAISVLGLMVTLSVVFAMWLS